MLLWAVVWRRHTGSNNPGERYAPNRCYFSSLGNIKMPYIRRMRWTKVFFCFCFLCLCRAYNSMISLKFSQSSSLWELEGQSSPTFQLPFLSVKRQSTVELLSCLGKTEQAQKLRETEGGEGPVTVSAQSFTSRHSTTLLPLPGWGTHMDKGAARRNSGRWSLTKAPKGRKADAPTAEGLPTCPHLSLLTDEDPNFGILCKARRDQHHGLRLLQLVSLHIWNICWVSLSLAGDESHG